MSEINSHGDYEMGNRTNDQILATITEMLNKGDIPWRKPWTGAKPRNADNRPYSGTPALSAPILSVKVDVVVESINKFW